MKKLLLILTFSLSVFAIKAMETAVPKIVRGILSPTEFRQEGPGWSSVTKAKNLITVTFNPAFQNDPVVLATVESTRPSSVRLIGSNKGVAIITFTGVPNKVYFSAIDSMKD